ncbi:hypothetical protein [Vibrio harveyi]|uniref:hypothetical protein n=1 Tax=Vibrio harveyi TaxID=669 RepID=UPI00217DA66A|nr:hypothetical protein [Vibrio harveyi]
MSPPIGRQSIHSMSPWDVVCVSIGTALSINAADVPTKADTTITASGYGSNLHQILAAVITPATLCCTSDRFSNCLIPRHKKTPLSLSIKKGLPMATPSVK